VYWIGAAEQDAHEIANLQSKLLQKVEIRENKIKRKVEIK